MEPISNDTVVDTQASVASVSEPAQTGQEPSTTVDPTLTAGEGAGEVDVTGETQAPDTQINEPTPSDEFVMKDYKVPSDLTIPDEALADILEVIKDIDFTKKSGVDELLRRVVNKNIEAQKAVAEAERVASEQFYSGLTESLKKDPDFGLDYDNNIAIGKRLVEELGGKEAIDFANNARLFDTPPMAKLFARLAKERRDATLIRGTAKVQEAPKTGTDSRGIPMFDVSKSLGSK
jgi:hypothetical protein